MKAHAPLVALVGGAGNERIYLARPAQNAQRPFIVVRRENTEQTYGTSANPVYARSIAALAEIITTTVVADDYEQAASINWLVREAVETKQGTESGPWLVQTDTMDDEDDLTSGNGTFIDMARITWRVNRKSFPTVT